jgi:hypothetical protein
MLPGFVPRKRTSSILFIEVAAARCSYEAIGAGELALITDSVRRVTGHDPTTLSGYVSAHPESLAHVAAAG